MTLARHMAILASAGALVLAVSVPAAAQAPLPPLPPVGGLTPPGGPPRSSAPPAPGPVSKARGSVTRGVDVAHTGHLADDGLVPPLTRRWTVRASQPVLAAAGRVYASRGRSFVALNPRNGRTLWRRPVSGIVNSVGAYDAGRVFGRDGDELIALDARSGAVLWRKQLPSNSYLGSPLATGGVLYLANTSRYEYTYALRESDGAELWKVRTFAGTFLPAVDGARLYLVGACGFAEARDRRDGHQLWVHDPGCSGGSLLTSALHGGRLWVPTEQMTADGFENPPVFAASDGRLVRRFTGELPVFVDGLAINPRGSRVTAVADSSGRAVWSRKGSLLEPIAVGHDVYGRVGREAIGARDAEHGRVVWRAKVRNRGYATPEFAAAPGLLLVATGDRLTAWESIFKPPPRGVDAGTTSFDPLVQERFLFGGVIGSRLRAARPRVHVQRARWHRGRFHSFASARPARDGFFQAPVRLRRNSRVRASVAGAHSRPLTIYAWPRFRFGRPRALGRRRALLRVSVRAPGTRLSGRRMVFYFARNGTRLRRLDTARIRGHRATFVFRPVRHIKRRDRVYVCIRGQLKLGLGRPDPLTRRCGARRIRLR